MKKLLALTIALALCLSLAPAVGAASEEGVRSAMTLKTLGLFRGSQDGMELDRAPTRMEGIIMLIRLLGEENEAYLGEWEHPFTDCPTWQNAEEYLGYAYSRGLTKGVSETLFDPNSPITLRECVTMTLRALGYVDGAWENWQTMADDIGLELPQSSPFLRGDAAILYCNALERLLADRSNQLIYALLDKGVFSQDELNWALAIKDDGVTTQSDLETIMAAIYAGVDQDISHLKRYNTPISEDNMAFYLGVNDLSISEGVASEPMMSSKAHSVCLVRMAPGADMDKAAAAVRENVDPNKWVCVGVEPENVKVVCRGDLLLLVMDDNYGDMLVNSFMAIK